MKIVCIFWSGFISESYLISNHTVVGRNPASPGMVLKPCQIMGYSKNQPQLVSWTRSSEPSTVWRHNFPPPKIRLSKKPGPPDGPDNFGAFYRMAPPPGKLDPRTTAGPANFWGCFFFRRKGVVEPEFFGRKKLHNLKSEMMWNVQYSTWKVDGATMRNSHVLVLSWPLTNPPNLGLSHLLSLRCYYWNEMWLRWNRVSYRCNEMYIVFDVLSDKDNLVTMLSSRIRGHLQVWNSKVEAAGHFS